MKFVFLSLILTLSCTKKVKLETAGVTPLVKDVGWKISNMTEGTWAVGATFRDVVSKNLTLVLSLPEFKNSDIKTLKKNYGVDSWLVKVNHKNKTGSRAQLAILLAPLTSRLQGSFGSNQTRSIAFSLTYAAWAMSERFRKFQCPAFSHRARLKDYSIIESDKTLDYNLSSIGKFHEAYTINELVPPKLIIADSMVGEYTMEAALFNTKTKTLFSSFQQIPTYLKITDEMQVQVSGCEGVQQEYDR